MARPGPRYPSSVGRGTLARGRSTFLTRTATDDGARLFRRSSVPASKDISPLENQSQLGDERDTQDLLAKVSPSSTAPNQPAKEHIKPARDGDDDNTNQLTPQSNSQRRKRRGIEKMGEDSLTGQMYQDGRSKSREQKPKLQRVSTLRPVGGSEKLGTFSGVFVPTSLNVLSILMFIRFGFILGQSGVVGMMGMLVAAYLINLVTTMSISAVASNGTVRGGGAYYLISRSLGPEFGGSIGIVFYLGFVFNTGMNAVGLIDCFNQNFGSRAGNWYNFLPEAYWYKYLWATVVLLICTAICLAGSSIFARASNGLLVILLVATFSIPLSALLVKPFRDPEVGTEFTGLSMKTFKENLMPHFTKHAAGSQLPGKENFQDLFGILFPATGGIFAGASMSGDLKNPSKSIPRGTLYGLALTFVSYTLVIFGMAASIKRGSFYENINVVQETNLSGILILLGEFATTFFSVLMGVIGPAKLLQAIARDSLLPGLSIFGQGTKKSDEPTYAIFLTYAVAQGTMLFDINRIASFVTMTYLMTFLVTNLACFLLKIASAPNFRPSFHYFNWWTAAAGAVFSGASMFFVDGLYATGCVGVLVVIFLLIHYTTPPKAWGDVSQSLIYHQVRKYLLRLRQEHVKFWRPQILLFVNDPRRGYKLIQFCNSLKKGALFILGHVIVTSNFGASVPEARRQQAAWTKYIDFSRIKAFVNVAISPSVEWGTRNIVLSAGLGGMRPNIVIVGFYNLQQFRQEQPLVDVPSPPPERKSRKSSLALDQYDLPKKRRRSTAAKQLEGLLPTDSCVIESRTDVQSYVMVLEDLILKLQINVAVAYGFQALELPNPKEGNVKKYIDLWPIQMSAEIVSESGQDSQNVLTTNFDTYTLILQLGCILNTVPSWRKSYKLRVAVFVEYESDVDEERERVNSLLENLRIEAEILVFWLASGDVKSYQFIVNGVEADADVETQCEKVLEHEDWWKDLAKMRGKVRTGDISAVEDFVNAEDVAWPGSVFQNGRKETNVARFEGLKQLLSTPRNQHSYGNLSSLGVRPGMRTHRLDDDLVSRHASQTGDSDENESNESDSIASDSAVEGSDDDEDSIALGEEESEHPSDATSHADAVHSPSTTESKKSRHSRQSLASSKMSHSSQRPTLRHTASRSSASEANEFSEANLLSMPSGGADLQGALVDVTSDNSSPLDETRPRGRSGVPVNAPDIDVMESTPLLDRRDLHVETGDPSRSSSRANFTSSSVPMTKVQSEEGVGPSIMFAEDPRRPERQKTVDEQDPRTIYQKRKLNTADSSTVPTPASGFPSVAAVQLSFNDLPSRAQHLILNELITQQTEDTAVIFTTLPAPVEGSYKSESSSLGYVSDLEVLCGGLPPTLLVHSNSMTVTMNL